MLLRRDGEHAALLVELAELGRVDVVVPEYVVREFRGTALRWIRDERERTDVVRNSANGWGRCFELGAPADDIRRAASIVAEQLAKLEAQVDEVIARLRNAAQVPAHTQAVHFRGEIRCLEGRPPNRPGVGLADCRIYEALLEIAEQHSGSTQHKFFVTRDSDFDSPELIEELARHGFSIRRDLGRLYGELRGK